MNSHKLTPRGEKVVFRLKVLLLLIILGAMAYGGYSFFKSKYSDTSKNGKEIAKVINDKKSNNDNPKSGKEKNTINISLDEWVGYKSIIDANGGLTTTPDSPFGKRGLKVNINVINDATQSSNALISGSLDAAGYTVNKTAFLYKKFKDAKVGVVLPFITNFSNGGDGIIATDKFNSVESLVDAKIGVPQYSESQAMVVWFVNQSDLSDADKKKIIDNLILFDTADNVAKAFFDGDIDVAATWQPYLTQAQNTSNCHVLFSTASSTKLILSGMLFRSDFAEANPDIVGKFIDGVLEAKSLYDNKFDAVREAMPMFSGMSDDDIKGMTLDASLLTWKQNVDTMKEDAPKLFSDMLDVWKTLGIETVASSDYDPKVLFDSKYLESLSGLHANDVAETVASANTTVVNDSNKQEVLDTQALLTKSASVNFIASTAKFTDTAEASKTLNDFISVAKMLDGTIIQIEGNTDPDPDTDPDDLANKMLSEQRAESVKQYFIMNGISASRIITVGNGSSKPMVDNTDEANRSKNRRTDVSFKIIEK